MAKPTGIRLRRNLSQASMRYPVVEQLGLPRKNRITLWMRDDRGQPSYLDFIKNAIELLRNKLLGEFNQQVRALVDGEVHRRLDKLLNVVVGEVKITSQKELRLFSDGRLKFCNLLAVDVGIERVSIVTVRCSNKMRYAIFGRDAAHRNSLLKRRSAVVDLPQRVTVNINHGNVCNPASPLIGQMFDVALTMPHWVRIVDADPTTASPRYSGTRNRR